MLGLLPEAVAEERVGMLEPVPLAAVPAVDMCGRPPRVGLLALDSDQLQSMLDEIHVNMTVVAVMASAGFDDMLANWLCFVKELPHLRNYVILTDSRAQADRLVRQGHPVFVMQHNVDARGSLDYGTVAYKQFILERTRSVLYILRFGYNVLLADVDAVWLEDPFAYMRDADVDIFGQLEAKGENLCGGFLYLKSTEPVFELWYTITTMFDKVVKQMAEEMRTKREDEMPKFLKFYEHLHEQRYLNALLRQNETKVVVKHLSVLQFPNGRDYFDRRKPQKKNVRPIVIHNNYIKGKQNKTRRFQRNGLWRIDSKSSICTCLTCRQAT